MVSPARADYLAGMSLLSGLVYAPGNHLCHHLEGGHYGSHTRIVLCPIPYPSSQGVAPRGGPGIRRQGICSGVGSGTGLILIRHPISQTFSIVTPGSEGILPSQRRFRIRSGDSESRPQYGADIADLLRGSVIESRFQLIKGGRSTDRRSFLLIDRHLCRRLDSHIIWGRTLAPLCSATEFLAENQEISESDRAILIEIVLRVVPRVAPACAEVHSKRHKVSEIHPAVSVKVRRELSQPEGDADI